MSKIKNIIILVLIGLGIFLWVTRPKKVDLKEYIKIDGKEYELLKQTRDTVYSDTTIYKTEYVPKYIKVPGAVVEIPADIDTTAILKDYYQKYYYEDIVNDIDGEGSTATIMDTISTNRIISRRTKFDIRNKIITETITVKEPDKLKVFIGGGVDFGATDLSLTGAKVGILVKPANDKVFRLDLGAFNSPGTNDITPYIGLGAYWKISFGKK
jgi:hypothetical protein